MWSSELALILNHRQEVKSRWDSHQCWHFVPLLGNRWRPTLPQHRRSKTTETERIIWEHNYPEGSAAQRENFLQFHNNKISKLLSTNVSVLFDETFLTFDHRRRSSAHLQHAGQVAGNALHQHAVGSQLGVLPAGDVAVALTDQESHLLHRSARVHVVAESLVDGRLPVVETGRHSHFKQRSCGALLQEGLSTCRWAPPLPPPTSQTARWCQWERAGCLWHSGRTPVHHHKPMNIKQTTSGPTWGRPPTFMNFSYWTADSIVLEE